MSDREVLDALARAEEDDDVWRDFKLAGRGSISRALGALVEEDGA